MNFSQSKLVSTAACLFAFTMFHCGKDSGSTAKKEHEPAVKEDMQTASHTPKTVKTYSAETFYQTTVYTGGRFSHDGSKLMVSSDKDGVFNVYAFAVDGSNVTQLTQSDANAIFGIGYFPTDDRLLYTSDQGGNELNHLYVREVDGSVKDLTPGDKVKAQFAGFGGDDKSFWVLTNERDEKSFDLYSYDAGDYSRKLVFENKDSLGVSSVSRDNNWVAFTKTRNNADNNMYLWNARTPGTPPKLISEHEGNVNFEPLTFSPDSQLLYYLTDEHGEFAQAWSYHLTTGKHEKVLERPWDISSLYFSKNGTYRVVSINDDARTSIEITKTADGSKVQLPNLPEGDLRGINFSADESWMAFFVNADTSPSNLYTHKIGSNTIQKLTEALNPAIDRDDLVEGTVVRYPSFDGLDIPAILYRPWPASVENKVPALVWVHGGPGGQSRHGYSATVQHLINHGYAILMVNNRGSSGYGKTFFHMDDRRHGDVDLKDCVYGRNYLASLDWVDGERIGIIGGSYGGYMVAAALAFEPEVFDVGIDIFGVTNWSRTLKNIPPWWESFKEYLYAEMGDPAEDAERHKAISPLFHADKITKPLLVVQGANDPRVLQAESDELVDAVRKNGVPVEYVLFPDEGHGFRRRENRVTASEAYVKFLETHLKEDREPIQ